MTVRKDSGFAKHFLWGAATSAHQVEGGNHNQWTVWELENARAKAAQAEFHVHDFPNWENMKAEARSPYNYVSDKLADHYNLYKDDFDLLQKMNMNAFRFSVEWSRIEPKEGAWDAEAIDHYKQYVAELKKRDIEPVMTLFHFTLPTWFTDMGGFERRGNVKYFTRYAEKIVSEIGIDVRYIITINEPDEYARHSYLWQDWPPAESNRLKWWLVVNNMALAHKRAAKLIHGLNRKYRVSIAKNSPYVYPGDDSIISRKTAEWLEYKRDDFIIKKFVKSCDFLGVNYYFTDRIYGTRIHNPDLQLSDLHWDMQPADIEFVLERLFLKYKLPILITENGVADAGDEHRQWWIRETIVAMQRAMKRDVKLIGYLHWSLLDNFEWAYGKWPRFGLAAVDYKTGKRTLRSSAVWFGGVVKKLRGL
jgi:beta-glucosidase